MKIEHVLLIASALDVIFITGVSDIRSEIYIDLILNLYVSYLNLKMFKMSNLDFQNLFQPKITNSEWNLTHNSSFWLYQIKFRFSQFNLVISSKIQAHPCLS